MRWRSILRLERFESRIVLATFRLPYVNFGPYIAPGENPNNGPGQVTFAELTQRLQAVAPYTDGFRTFKATGDQEPAAAIIRGLGKKAAIGTFINGNTVNDQGQLSALIAQAKAGNVDIAIVGNETQQFSSVPEATLISYINQVKTEFATAGLNIPVTTADTYNSWLAHPNVIAACDIIWAHVYPFFENAPIDIAVSDLSRNYRLMQQAAGSKQVILGETGWPSAGTNGVSVPSPQNAARYFFEATSWARSNGVTFSYFEAYDEPWKTNEGTFGPHWGLFDSNMVMKPGRQAIFDGAVTASPFVDFFAGPTTTRTNIAATIVSGIAIPGHIVSVNGVPLSVGEYDALGAFVRPVALAPGNNAVTVAVSTAGGQPVRSATRTFSFDTAYSTAGRELLYVDVVNSASSGTVVIDVAGNSVIGFMAGSHVRGISPNGQEVYMDTGAVVSTVSHATVRILPFSTPINTNSFLVSPTGDRLYSGNQVVDVATNMGLVPLPVNITTGSSFGGASIPGGPAISADGKTIFASNPIIRIDTTTNTSTATGITAPGPSLSDIELSADGTRLLLSTYGVGGLTAYNSTSYQSLGSVAVGDFTGEIRSTVGGNVVIGNSGNPFNFGGGVTLAGLAPPLQLSRIRNMLADNLATNATGDVVFTSSGERAGVDLFTVGLNQRLTLSKSFVLGSNQYFRGTGAPANDHIRAIVHKPGTAVVPTVAGVVVNGGMAQRSRVTNVAITFSEQLSFVNPNDPAAAFQLTRIGGGALGGFTAMVGLVNGATVVTLADFTGAETQFGSLADGRYSLVVLANQIANLDGDGNGTLGDNYVLVGNTTTAPKLYRLFGDADGDGDVDANDFGQFRAAFGTINNVFDFDNDNDVDATDFGNFRLRFGVSV